MTDLADIKVMNNLSGDIKSLLGNVKTLSAQLKTEKQKSADLEFELHQYMMHYVAEKELRKAAMEELDKAYGKDKNPLRQAAYDANTDFRIPSGDRKGQVATLADHIYLTKCSEVFKKHYARVHTHIRNWKEFLHDYVS